MSKFDPDNADHLDSKERRERLAPDDIFSLLDIEKNDTVLDFGAGTGFLTFPISRRLTDGKVYAVDVQEEMLDKLRKKCQENGCKNVEVLLNEEGSIPIKDEEIDTAFLINVLHEIDDEASFEELYRVVKKGGKMCVVDWDREGGTSHGPPASERFSLEEAIELLERYGFFSIKSYKNPDHFFVSLQK